MSESGQSKKPRLAFSVRTVLEIIAVAAFILTLMYTRRPSPPTQNGRFQVIQVPHARMDLPRVYVLDTQTGTMQAFDD